MLGVWLAALGTSSWLAHRAQEHWTAGSVRMPELAPTEALPSALAERPARAARHGAERRANLPASVDASLP
ncbi:hypothetical protein FGE12_19535 [Aggregicoccus sp. 17bor-14]|uniref:hypothetical protein n=1 Tax=Myxococcaceae TaxID=31 RepID=UPI00129C33D9|nr:MULTISPECIES: hypothetical protein [Myxococcaceae]MBF5044602.1 hypothetical protein [Simulacricoccus sp. 17bor-14]MRI90346.1 hypothetical protein [Aggregicoccus sp. 17bor-14]